MKFGEMPDGEDVTRHRIEGGGLTAYVMSYGATLQDLRLAGHQPPLVLGFDRFTPYLTDMSYFGAVVGRCVNRIGAGRFEIDGKAYQLDLNFENRHHMHGGSLGAGKRNWTVENVSDDQIILRLDMADEEMGYPGNLTVRCTYTCLEGGVLDVRITAETDAPTVCNFAHHSYWNLDGGENTHDHLMQVDADRITDVDADFISTGRTLDVTGTRCDFRKARPIHDDVFIDNNLCLSDARQPLRPIGSLSSTASGVTMKMHTTEAGLQVYDAYKMQQDQPGLDGRIYGPRAGVALEPQAWPDAVNHASFPTAVLRPNETYEQHTQFEISKG
ncbi:MAG: aldose epimerase family protein [Litoreibacter sp.]|uniref:aldose epimerase family protein n=1 Tax=Litoreibacter sp. TaxID=1969459 RepID=UPI003297F2FB